MAIHITPICCNCEGTIMKQVPSAYGIFYCPDCGAEVIMLEENDIEYSKRTEPELWEKESVRARISAFVRKHIAYTGD